MRSFHARLCAFALLTLFGAQALAAQFGATAPVIPHSIIVVALGLTALGGITGLGLYALWIARTASPSEVAARIGSLAAKAPEFTLHRVTPMLAAFLFLGAIGTYKSLIPEVQPFAWDTILSDFDRTVFGTDPWRLTHAIVGPAGTQVIDLLYGLWFAEWAVAVACFSLFAGHEAQRRFFVALLALWGVFGFAMAIAFSSAGPVFLDLIGHPYAARYPIPLDSAPGAEAARSFLIDAYTNGRMSVGNGISAMPSMHVAVSVLIALAVPRRLKIAAWTYAAVIMFGSVHLGWHYASDGVIGGLGAWAVWTISQRALSPRLKSTSGP